MKKLIKCAVAFIIMLCVILDSNAAIIGYAANDTESATYGFYYSTDDYKTSTWYNTVTIYCKRDGNTIGVCTVNIGTTRSKKTVSGGKYLEQIMIKCTMRGKNTKTGYAGFSEHLKVKSTLPSGMQLAAYSPETQAGMSSYTLGGSFGIEEWAVSASTTVNKNALNITNYSDESDRFFCVCYDYENNWRAGSTSEYNTYGKYAYAASVQRCNYTFKPNSYVYGTCITVTPKFEWMSGTGINATQYKGYASVNKDINIIISN